MNSISIDDYEISVFPGDGIFTVVEYLGYEFQLKEVDGIYRTDMLMWYSKEELSNYIYVDAIVIDSEGATRSGIKLTKEFIIQMKEYAKFYMFKIFIERHNRALLTPQP